MKTVGGDNSNNLGSLGLLIASGNSIHNLASLTIDTDVNNDMSKDIHELKVCIAVPESV